MPRWDHNMPEIPAGPGVPLLTQIKRWAIGITALIFVIVALKTFFSCVIRVDSGKIAILVKKTGKDLPSTEIVPPDDSYKGIQEAPLTEGWHFINPYTWEAITSFNGKDIEQVNVPDGSVGVKVRLFGQPLPAGQVLAEGKQRGILADSLTPGRYAINPFLYRMEIHPAVTIPGKHIGVVTLLAGKEPKDPNRWVVDPGERGTQPTTVSAGIHYVNPYERWIFPVSLESFRFTMNDQDPIEFPSKDGFQIRMHAAVEWSVDPDHVPELFVQYVDDRAFKLNVAEKVDEMVKTIVVEKVILPNARAFSRIEGSKHLAKELMGRETREALQAEVYKGVKEACAKQGIIIHSVSVLEAQPPDAISSPIRDREMAIRQRDMYDQQIARQKQDKSLQKEKTLQKRSSDLKQAEADVAVQITQAQREKEVALIEAQRKLEVAKKELEAAKNQAAATLATGQAEADVIVYQNTAEASGIKAARAAFGDGSEYVRFLFHQKVAPAIKYVLSNTDGPFVDIFKDFSKEQGK